MSNTQVGQRVGEVTVSHTERVDAQCYQLHAPPPLGALVRIGAPPVYAVVREIRNEPLDPSRPLAPRGVGLESEDELYAANPQLATMLTTRFTATIVGHRAGLAVRHGLPERPPNLHAFVFVCDGAEMADFAGELGCLRLLLADGSPGGDAALASFVRLAAGATADGGGFLRRAGRTLAAELSREPLRLQALLREMAR